MTDTNRDKDSEGSGIDGNTLTPMANTPSDDSAFDIDTSSAFIRSELDPRGGSPSAIGVYNDGQSTEPSGRQGDSADEIDPRHIVRTPSINEIRWYYHRTFAKTLVDKPINDAFKNGFEIDGPDAARAQRLLDQTDYIEKYKLAEKKARRDGFALLMYVFEDTTDGVQEDPFQPGTTVEDIVGINVLTIDHLHYTDGRGSASNLREHVPLDWTEYEIRQTGMVVDKRLSEPTYNEPIGYIVGPKDDDAHIDPTFVHANRVQHLTWNQEVDGDMGADTLGRYEGDGILVPSYDLLKSLKKANWAIGQTLFRYASKLYAVNMPEDANEDDQEEASKQLRNLNSKSELILPHGYDVEDYETDGQLEPRDYFDVLFEQVCASNEMTKSVLFGTQQGTVTGSETDIKNYFNKVERYRHQRAESKIREFTNTVAAAIDGRARGPFDMDYSFEWGPMFQLDEEARAEVLRTQANTLGMAIDNFLLDPDEARSIMSEEWASLDVDGAEDLSDLTDDQMEVLEEINLNEMGQQIRPESEQAEIKGNPLRQNGGGREQGSTNASTDPTSN